MVFTQNETSSERSPLDGPRWTLCQGLKTEDQKLTNRQHQYKINKIPYYTVYNMGTAHKEGDFCSTFFKNEDFYGGRFFGRVRATYIDAPILYNIVYIQSV